MPFSSRLNGFIRNWWLPRKHLFTYSNHDRFNDYDNQAEYFQSMLENWKNKRVIEVWNGASDNNIYGYNEVNIKMRCWHDYTHVVNNLDFSAISETLVSSIQVNELPKNWQYEKDLLNADLLGQTQYYWINDCKFVENQRKFVADYLVNPLNAIKKDYKIKEVTK